MKNRRSKVNIPFCPRERNMLQQKFVLNIVTIVTLILPTIWRPDYCFAGFTKVQISPTLTKESINSSISPSIKKKITTFPSIQLKKKKEKREVVGFCCKDGVLLKKKLTQTNCEASKHCTFYRSKSEADKYCGFCCDKNGTTIALEDKRDKEQCLNGKRAWNFYDTKTKADSNCGWCTLKEKVFPVTNKLKECTGIGGTFHNTKLLAFKAAKSENGFCNLDNETTVQLGERECKIQQGKFFTILGMARADLMRQKKMHLTKINDVLPEKPTNPPKIAPTETSSADEGLDFPDFSKRTVSKDEIAMGKGTRLGTLKTKFKIEQALKPNFLKDNFKIEGNGKQIPQKNVALADKQPLTKQPTEGQKNESETKTEESEGKSTSKRVFKSYFEKSNNGRIDWYQGKIYGVGRGYLNLNGKSKAKSLRTAQKIADENVLKLAATIRLDNHMSLRRFSMDLRNLIHTRSSSQIYVDHPINPYYEVTLVAQLKGADGLISKVAPLFQKLSNPLKKRPSPSTSSHAKHDLDDDDKPWLVLDGRDLHNRKTIQPALFPKILDDKGRELYNLNLVNAAALTVRGMASYAVSEHSQEDIESGNFIAGRFFQQIISFLSVGEAIAGEAKNRTKRRKYIVKNVKESQGLNNTNLLISADDADELREEDKASNILKNCRVIVIKNSPTGGIDGTLRRYFAYLNMVNIGSSSFSIQ